MLPYKTFLQFLRMLIEMPQAAGSVAPAEPLASLFEQGRKQLFISYTADGARTEMAGLTMRLFTLWRERLCPKPGSTPPSEGDLHAISYGEWEAAMHAIYWAMPCLGHLHMECIAVTVAECHLRLGHVAICHLQSIVGAAPTARIDRATVYAVARAATTRQRGRDLCRQMLGWRTASLAATQRDASAMLAAQRLVTAERQAERIEAFLLRLDLSDDERP